MSLDGPKWMRKPPLADCCVDSMFKSECCGDCGVPLYKTDVDCPVCSVRSTAQAPAPFFIAVFVVLIAIFAAVPIFAAMLLI